MQPFHSLIKSNTARPQMILKKRTHEVSKGYYHYVTYEQLLLFLFNCKIILVCPLLFSQFLILTIVSILKTRILQKEGRLVLVRPCKPRSKSVHPIYFRKASFNTVSTRSQSLSFLLLFKNDILKNKKKTSRKTSLSHWSKFKQNPLQTSKPCRADQAPN